MPTTNLKKLENFLVSMDKETLTQQDFESAFQRVLTVVKNVLLKQEKFEIELDSQNREFRQIIKQELSKALGDLRTQTNELFVKEKLNEMSLSQKGMFESFRTKLGSDFSDKLTNLDTEIKRRALPGPQGRPPTRQEIDTALVPIIEELKKEKEEIKKELERFRDTRSNKAMGRAKVPMIKRVNLSDQLNGEQKEFTLPKDTVDILGVWGTQFPINFNPTDGENADWNLVGNTLVLTSEVPAPEAGQTLYALVETLFY